MTARTNRLVLIIFGLLLMVIGGLAAALGGGTFGQSRADRAVIDNTVIHWWNEGGWKSFAVLAVIGLVLATIGVWLMLGQLRVPRSARVSAITFPPNGQRGETQLRPSALRQTVEADLARLPGITQASVQLAGTYPTIELHARLTVADDSQLDKLRNQLAVPLSRVEATTGIRLAPITVVLRFAPEQKERQLM